MLRKFFYFTALVFALNIFIGIDSYGQQLSPKETKIEKTLKDLYERLLLTSKNRDEKALREILTDKYSQVTNSGRIRTKEIRIKETLSPDDVNEILALESFKLYVYQNVAVATCLVRNKGKFKGEDYDFKLMSTATFVKEGKVWRIAATHLSEIKE